MSVNKKVDTLIIQVAKLEEALHALSADIALLKKMALSGSQNPLWLRVVAILNGALTVWLSVLTWLIVKSGFKI